MNAYIITYHMEQTMSYFTFHLSRNLHIDYILISFSMFSDLNLSLIYTQLEKSTIIWQFIEGFFSEDIFEILVWLQFCVSKHVEWVCPEASALLGGEPDRRRR